MWSTLSSLRSFRRSDVEGFDYSDTSAKAAALVKAGAKFVVRYVGTSPKCLTVGERNALHAAGLGIGLVYEVGGTSFTGGNAAGQKDGAAAKKAAALLGVPAGTVIYFAIDTDTSDLASCRAYLAGCHDAVGPYTAKLYAGFKVIDVVGAGDHWQTYAWSNGRISKQAGLYQYQNNITVGGVSVDKCRTLANGPVIVGGWLSYTLTPVVPPVAPPVNPIVHPVAAVKDLLRLKGNTNAHAAEALKFEKGQNASGAASWKDECAKLVRTGYGISASAWGKTKTTAAGAWGAVPKADRHGWYNPPVGVPVFWTGGSTGAGHVALADGQGNVWTNDFGPNGYVGDGRVRLVPISSIVKHDSALKYVGWSNSYLGARVYN